MESNTIWWNDFCGNISEYDAFWSREITDSTSPDLTSCFQKTILVWVPGLFMLVGSVTYLSCVRNSVQETPGRGLSKLGLLQLVGEAVLITLCLLDIIYYITVNRSNLIHPVDYMAAACNGLSFVIMLIFQIKCSKQGIYNTGVAFVFWLLLFLGGTVTLRSSILQHTGSSTFPVVTFLVYYSVVTLQFLLTFIPDHGKVTSRQPSPEASPLLSPKNSTLSTVYKAVSVKKDKDKADTQTKLNPMFSCSFPGFVLFNWFTQLVLKGYKRELVWNDIWKCRIRDGCETIVPVFYKNWNKTLAIAKTQRPHAYTNGELHSKHKENSEEKHHEDDVEAKGRMLLWTLVQTFGIVYFSAGLVLVAFFAASLLNPVLLSALLTYLESEDPLQWKGYFLATAMFCTAVMDVCCFHHHVYITTTVGMRIRTALTTAIYRKALLLSTRTRAATTSGEIVNLMSVDVQQVQESCTYLHYVWSAPIVIAVSLYFLWQQLGPSCLAGLIYMVAVVLINSLYITRKVVKVQDENMKIKDERIKLMNQVLLGIKVLKLYAWEPHFQKKLEEIRAREARTLLTFQLMHALSFILIICTPFMVALLSFGTFVLSDSANVLTPQNTFVSLSYLNIINIPLNFAPMVVMYAAQSMVSLRRISKYLQYDEVDPYISTQKGSLDSVISIQDGTFSWGDKRSASLRNINLSVVRGGLIAVVGEVGSGKSSLIAALLGEMTKLKGDVKVVGSQAYVPQQAWIQNLTLQDNILFGKKKNEQCYKDVLEACALTEDLASLPGGDMTEIGERGINLSGGQKQRVSLARAVYEDADVYLLDDPLSAVDAHVGKHIFTHVIGRQGCLKFKTRIFVTNQIQYLEHADEVIVMDNGTISERGTYEQLIQQNGRIAAFLRSHLRESSSDSNLDQDGTGQENMSSQVAADQSADTPATSHPTGVYKRRKSRRSTAPSDVMSDRDTDKKSVILNQENLLEEETVKTGTIELGVLRWYVSAASMAYSVTTLVSVLSFAAAQACANIWLSSWSNDADVAHAQNRTVDPALVYLRLGVYSALGAAEAVAAVGFMVGMSLGAVKAAKVLHNKLLDNVLKSPMSFFDRTPLGRIINRFSKDVDHMDKNVPEFLQETLLFGAPLLATLVVIIYSVPILAAVFIPLILLFAVIQRAYANTARQLKRLDSVKRSPIYNFFSETLNGVTSIRAYGCQQRFLRHNDVLLDQSQSIWFTVYTAKRWMSLYGEMLSNFVILFTAIVAVYQRDAISAGLAGLALTYSLEVGEQLMLVLRSTCDLENYIIAVERIKEYAELPTEACWESIRSKPPVEWPQSGGVELHNYSTRYRPGLDLVLKDVTCSVNPREKVGIVGRTGAGKSSLALALFRVIEPSVGSIRIDGEDISKYGLHDVRSKLSIIPQDPVLFSGSLRFNIDPSGEYSDEDLWIALDHAHLKTFVKSLPFSIEYECGENGENLSVGQRQLVCLARALLRKTKILVLDEATASVDMETDRLIQETIRSEFKDCTVITIAHRLNTILDNDRVMVMEAGSIKEYQDPKILLQDKTSTFYSMAKDANIV